MNPIYSYSKLLAKLEISRISENIQFELAWLSIRDSSTTPVIIPQDSIWIVCSNLTVLYI